MKLQDLIIEERAADYVERLTKTLGIKELGRGYYSAVFQHPVYHNVAVKLCLKKDPETIRYLRKAAKHPDNPWLPKIVGIHEVTFSDLDQPSDARSGSFVTHLVFMQKLRPATLRDERRAIDLILSTLPRTSALSHLRGIKSLVELDEGDWAAIAKTSSDRHVRQLAALLGAIGADDIHRANIMVSDDGHPVITDPVAS